jgi:hypothetical protein
MNSPLDRSGGSDDPLRDAPERKDGPAEPPDITQWLLEPDVPARRIGDFAEEDIGPPAISPLGEGSRVEPVRVPSLLPVILDRDILDLRAEIPRRAGGSFGTFARFALATSIFVVAVFTVLSVTRTLPTGWTGATGGHAIQADLTPPRFIEQTRTVVELRTQGATEQPNSPRVQLVNLRVPPGGPDEATPLGLSLTEFSGDAALLLSGLPAGSTISTGVSLGAGNWLLSASELSDAAIRPPRGFIGTIDLAIELVLAGDTVADRLSLRLTWVETPKTTKETTNAIAAAQTTAVAAPVETGSTGTQPGETPNSQPPGAPLRRLDREEITALLKRGEEFMAAGNLGPARLAFRRAAEAADSRAAFLLATTYDPMLLERRGAIGVVPDIAMAQTWYEKAKEFGSASKANEFGSTSKANEASSASKAKEFGSASVSLRLDREEITNLLKRGEEFMAAGNLGPARLAFRRAAEAGDPQAAFLLATTYDPVLLETRGVIGVVPDIAMARAWYEKAKGLGSANASRRLEVLASRDR